MFGTTHGTVRYYQPVNFYGNFGANPPAQASFARTARAWAVCTSSSRCSILHVTRKNMQITWLLRQAIAQEARTARSVLKSYLSWAPKMTVLRLMALMSTRQAMNCEYGLWKKRTDCERRPRNRQATPRCSLPRPVGDLRFHGQAVFCTCSSIRSFRQSSPTACWPR